MHLAFFWCMKASKALNMKISTNLVYIWIVKDRCIVAWQSMVPVALSDGASTRPACYRVLAQTATKLQIPTLETF